MSCNFNWYNLPKEINKIIKPFTDIKVYWYNLPISLDKVYKEILSLKPSCNSTKKFQWFSLNKKAEIICELVDCLESGEYNFDVTSSDWGGIIDASSFKNYLEAQTGESSNNVSDFILIKGRIRCNISNIQSLRLTSKNITKVNKISINGLQRIFLNSNDIIDFNPLEELPSSLILLDLSLNSIVNFNPVITLPSNLQTLALDSNQIINFNPTTSLPLNLRGLLLTNNKIVSFNLIQPFPSQLQNLFLTSNQMTTQGYINSEPWANALNNGTATFYFNNNIDSAETSNLRSILVSKGYSVAI